MNFFQKGNIKEHTDEKDRDKLIGEQSNFSKSIRAINTLFPVRLAVIIFDHSSKSEGPYKVRYIQVWVALLW